MLAAMREGQFAALAAERLRDRIMRDAAERDDGNEIAGPGYGFIQEWPAGFNLGRGRFVFRWHAAHRICDPAIDELQPVIGL